MPQQLEHLGEGRGEGALRREHLCVAVVGSRGGEGGREGGEGGREGGREGGGK